LILAGPPYRSVPDRNENVGTRGNPDTKYFGAAFLEVRLWIIPTRRRKDCGLSKKFTVTLQSPDGAILLFVVRSS
jgi:hypothetical protein